MFDKDGTSSIHVPEEVPGWVVTSQQDGTFRVNSGTSPLTVTVSHRLVFSNEYSFPRIKHSLISVVTFFNDNYG